MAGATKCYKVWVDHTGELQRKLVEHSPKYATKLATAVGVVRKAGIAYVAPTDWRAFEEEWNKEGQ